MTTILWARPSLIIWATAESERSDRVLGGVSSSRRPDWSWPIFLRDGFCLERGPFCWWRARRRRPILAGCVGRWELFRWAWRVQQSDVCWADGRGTVQRRCRAGWCEEVKVWCDARREVCRGSKSWFQFRHSSLLTSRHLKAKQKPTSGEWRGFGRAYLIKPAATVAGYRA